MPALPVEVIDEREDRGVRLRHVLGRCEVERDSFLDPRGVANARRQAQQTGLKAPEPTFTGTVRVVKATDGPSFRGGGEPSSLSRGSGGVSGGAITGVDASAGRCER